MPQREDHPLLEGEFLEGVVDVLTEELVLRNASGVPAPGALYAGGGRCARVEDIVVDRLRIEGLTAQVVDPGVVGYTV